MLEKYLKKDGSLDIQKVYKAMQEITGFNSKKNREDFHERIMVMYRAHTNPEVVPF